MKNAAVSIGVALLLIVCGVALGVVYLKPYVGERIANTVHIVTKEVVRSALDRKTKDFRRQMECVARDTTAAFVMEHMPKVRAFSDRFALLDHSLKSVDPNLQGLYCEFGVFTGASINRIAANPALTVHGFDSFEGLPETWRTGFEKGYYAMPKPPEVPANVKLHKGWFHETLPAWAKENSGPLAFVHLDADLYSSTKTVFDVLGARMVPGTVIQFGAYFNYPGWQEGEFKAFQEWVAARQVKFEYLGYCDRGEQVAVKLVSVGTPSSK